MEYPFTFIWPLSLSLSLVLLHLPSPSSSFSLCLPPPPPLLSPLSCSSSCICRRQRVLEHRAQAAGGVEGRPVSRAVHHDKRGMCIQTGAGTRMYIDRFVSDPVCAHSQSAGLKLVHFAPPQYSVGTHKYMYGCI